MGYIIENGIFMVLKHFFQKYITIASIEKLILMVSKEEPMVSIHLLGIQPKDFMKFPGFNGSTQNPQGPKVEISKTSEICRVQGVHVRSFVICGINQGKQPENK